MTTPLVLFRDLALCDGPGQHEIVLLTDGIRAYAYGGSSDLRGLLRDGVKVSATCSQLTGHDAESILRCDGHVEWDLSIDEWGVPNASTAELLYTYGSPFDHADTPAALTIGEPSPHSKGPTP